MRPLSVVVALPNSHLPWADWADRYEIELPEGRFTPIEAAEQAFGQAPAWIGRLMTFRNRIVAPFGLKGGHLREGKGRFIGAFPVLAADGREAVLGVNDRHLDFRVLVDVRPNGAHGQIVGMTTLIHRKNLFGRIYLAVVTPFHKVIVRTLLSRLSRV